MARPSYEPGHVNENITREAAERLQVQLFETAEEALKLARADQKIPSGLITACHQLLKDSAALGVDMRTDEEKAQQDADELRYRAPRWSERLADDLGIEL